MKKSPVFYFKIGCLITGFALITLSFFSEFASTCRFEDDFDDIVPISLNGSKTTLWYLFFLGSIVVFCTGYFLNNLSIKIFVYTFSGMFTLLISFIVSIQGAGWGQPCGISVENGYYLALLGSLLILTATISSMHRKKKLTKNISDHFSLLDQE